MAAPLASVIVAGLTLVHTCALRTAAPANRSRTQAARTLDILRMLTSGAAARPRPCSLTSTRPPDGRGLSRRAGFQPQQRLEQVVISVDQAHIRRTCAASM